MATVWNIIGIFYGITTVIAFFDASKKSCYLEMMLCFIYAKLLEVKDGR